MRGWLWVSRGVFISKIHAFSSAPPKKKSPERGCPVFFLKRCAKKIHPKAILRPSPISFAEEEEVPAEEEEPVQPTEEESVAVGPGRVVGHRPRRGAEARNVDVMHPEDASRRHRRRARSSWTRNWTRTWQTPSPRWTRKWTST